MSPAEYLKDFIFWRQPLRLTGPVSPAGVMVQLHALLSAGRFSFQDRLVGSLQGNRLRVRKKNLAGYAGDAVEFDGILRAGDPGCVIEGTLQYRLQTKFQFVGLLAIGLGVVAIGVAHADGTLAAVGGFVAMLTLIWIYAGHRTRHLQIRFIEDKLNEVVAHWVT
ncbi:MAG: hypothetical protein Q8L95_08465 [Burkholderiales bacterium]|nr:hypothetical protein [Burkholderiales bacterium]